MAPYAALSPTSHGVVSSNAHTAGHGPLRTQAILASRGGVPAAQGSTNSTRNVSVSLDGWVTTVVDGHNIVITRGPSSAASFDETLAEALTVANRGLDAMCVRGRADWVIRDGPGDCLAWWPDTALDRSRGFWSSLSC